MKIRGDMRRALRLMVAALILAFAGPLYADCAPADCMVDKPSVGYGPVRENDGASYRAFRFDDRLSEHWQATLGGIIGGDHPTFPNHASRALDYRTYWIGASYLEVEQYLYGSVGVVKLSRETKHLTSPFQFLITFGVHYGAASLAYVHLSNGHTGGKNYGEDMLIVGWGF